MPVYPLLKRNDIASYILGLKTSGASSPSGRNTPLVYLRLRKAKEFSNGLVEILLTVTVVKYYFSYLGRMFYN